MAQASLLESVGTCIAFREGQLDGLHVLAST